MSGNLSFSLPTSLTENAFLTTTRMVFKDLLKTFFFFALFQVILRLRQMFNKIQKMLFDGLKSISLSRLKDYKSQDVPICAPHNDAF